MLSKLFRRHSKLTGLEDVLSPDPQTRLVELALLERLAEVARKASVAALAHTNDPSPELTAYARFTNPVFDSLARRLETQIPEDAGFGKFRAKRKQSER